MEAICDRLIICLSQSVDCANPKLKNLLTHAISRFQKILLTPGTAMTVNMEDNKEVDVKEGGGSVTVGPATAAESDSPISPASDGERPRKQIKIEEPEVDGSSASVSVAVADEMEENEDDLPLLRG